MSWGRTRGQVIDINRSPNIEIPRLRKRQHSAPGSLSQLSPREAIYEMAMTALPIQPSYSCLRCSAQRQTATWLLYRVLYRVLYSLLAGCNVCHFAHARPTMPSISLVLLQKSFSTVHGGSVRLNYAPGIVRNRVSPAESALSVCNKSGSC